MHPIELIHPRSLKHLAGSLQTLVAGRLWLRVLLGMVLGIATGVVIGPSTGWVGASTAVTIGSWLALPGQVFLGTIQMIVIPLVFASVIRGIAGSRSLEELRFTGLRAGGYFVLTSTLAITIGIGVAWLVQPGRFLDPEVVRSALAGSRAIEAQVMPLPGSVPEAIVQLIPRNPLGALVNAEMLGVIVFALVFGVALVALDPEESRPLLALLGSLQKVCMTVVRWAMWLAPFAVFGLMAQLTSKLGLSALVGMSVYVGTVLLGLALLVVVYMGIVLVGARTSPLRFLSAAREVQLLAFSTSSSAAVMPLSMKTAEEKLDVRSSISQLVIPLGATINMDGTALYQGVATVFLAQVFGLELGVSQLVLVVVTAVAASIGSPATPGVGIVVLSTVLASAGIPLEGVGLIIGVDRILDMSRTAVNVTGDLVASLVLSRYAPTTATREEERRREAEREAERRETSADVIVDEPPERPEGVSEDD